MAKTVLKERLIVKAILATEARVHGHPLVTFVYVNTVDMGLHAYQQSTSQGLHSVTCSITHHT